MPTLATHSNETIVAKVQISQLYKETERDADALDGVAGVCVRTTLIGGDRNVRLHFH